MRPLTDQDILNLFFISLAFACVWPGILIKIHEWQKKQERLNFGKESGGAASAPDHSATVLDHSTETTSKEPK